MTQKKEEKNHKIKMCVQISKSQQQQVIFPKHTSKQARAQRERERKEIIK